MDKAKTYIVICVVLIIGLLVGWTIAGARSATELAELRRVNSELADRNRELEYANTELARRFDAVANAISSAQRRAGEASDTIGRIRALVDGIEAVARELRKQTSASPGD